MTKSKNFVFDGGAADFLGTMIVAWLITVLTLSLAYPWALVMIQSWKTKHTIINGRRLKFVGTGAGLFGNWIKWVFFCIITLGIYSFWLVPALQQWTVEHTDFEDA